MEGARDSQAEEASRASDGAVVTHPKENMRRDSSGVQGRGRGGLQNAHKVLQEETALDASRIFLWQRAQTLYHRYLRPHTEQPHSGAGRQEGSHPFPPSSLLISQEKREKNLLKHPRPSHPHLVPGKDGQGGRTNSG